MVRACESKRLIWINIQNPEEAAELKKKRTFRKFSYRGIDLDQYVVQYTLPF